MSRSEADVQDLRMMERCLELARQGVKQGELPFGAVIASRGQVIAEATNRVSSECDVTRHAELVALSEAQKILRQKRLPDCTLYSIVEPCPMCSFPAREARIGRVVFAISSPIMGGFSRWDVLSDDSFRLAFPKGRAGLERLEPARLAIYETTRLHRTRGRAAFAPCGRASAKVFLECPGGYFGRAGSFGE